MRHAAAVLPDDVLICASINGLSFVLYFFYHHRAELNKTGNILFADCDKW